MNLNTTKHIEADQEIIKTLEALGCDHVSFDADMGSYSATIKAEPYDTGKHHFKPKYRTIYISGEMYPRTDRNFIYITSDLLGTMRRYRARYWYDTSVGNIFASAKEIKPALEAFVHNYKHKLYNSGKSK